MRKFLVIGLVGILCGIGAVSCGNDAPFDAVLDMPTLAPPGALACGDSVGYPHVQVTVLTSDGDPIPGANVDITLVGVGAETIMYSDVGLTPGNEIASSLGPIFLVHTTTDGFGAVYINLGATVNGAPTSFTATFGFTVTISTDQQSAVATSAVSC
jgi:hypothetical protein